MVKGIDLHCVHVLLKLRGQRSCTTKAGVSSWTGQLSYYWFLFFALHTQHLDVLDRMRW